MANDIANLNQFLLCDVFDAYFYDENDNLLFQSVNLTSSDITGKSDSQEVRNGKGNGLFAKLWYNKSCDISLKTNTFSMYTLALLTGGTVGTGNGTCYSNRETFTINSTSGIVTLEKEPLKSTAVKIFLESDGSLIPSTKYTISEKEITFSDEDLKGKKVIIMPFEYAVTDEVIKEVQIDSDKFPSSGKLILKGIEKDSKTKTYANLTIICPNVSLSSDFTLSTSSEVKPSEPEIKLSVQNEVNGKRMLTLQEEIIQA